MSTLTDYYQNCDHRQKELQVSFTQKPAVKEDEQLVLQSKPINPETVKEDSLHVLNVQSNQQQNTER